MKSWVGTGEEGGQERVCIVCVLNARVFVLHKELTFCRICRNALKIVTCTLKRSDKASFLLGNELWEEHFESLLVLVNYNGDMGEEKIVI